VNSTFKGKKILITGGTCSLGQALTTRLLNTDVPVAEYNPFEAVKTNVYGTQNLIESCIIKKFNYQ